MKTYHMMRLASITLMLLISSACSGGGQGSNAPNVSTTIIKLSTNGTPSAKMAGVGITIVLPTGVAPALNSDGTVANTVIEVTGVATSGTVLAPAYTPATSSSNPTLHFAMASSLVDGFGSGEFATITLQTSSGNIPAPSDYSLSGFAPISLTGSPVTGLSATVN